MTDRRSPAPEPAVESAVESARGFRLTDLDTVLTTTRSVRRRLDLERPVPRAVVLDCLQMALQAPTGADAEDWRFVLIGDPAVRAAVADQYRRVFDAQVRPRLPGILCGASVQERRRARIYRGATHLADHLHRVPWLVLACATRPYPEPEHAASVYGSVFPAVWSFQLALRSRGLGSLLTTLHLREPAGMAALLGIPAGVTQCALVPVAYTIGTDFRPAARRPVAEVVFADRWGTPLDGGSQVVGS